MTSFTTHPQPAWGQNPFSDNTTTLESTGGYEIYLTPNGTEGYTNELALPGTSEYYTQIDI